MGFKIVVGYPAMPSSKGVALVSQNRQFQWFNRPTFIFPVVPATAATLLSKNGYEVLWGDGVASQMSEEEYSAWIAKEEPDLVAFEVKVAVVKRTWAAIRALKKVSPNTKFVLMGDHITAMPEESFGQCPVDYCIAGGDFDFALLNLANHLNRGEDLEAGVYWRDGDTIGTTGKFALKHNLDDLPAIDRDLSQWKLYSQDNGNFKYTPGTYTMVGRDCWWGRCTFCSWTTTFTNFRVIKVEKMLDEVQHLVENYGVREIFDDTGTFPGGKWLMRFCEGMVERGLHKKVTMGCNMKPGALKQEHWNAMGRAGFRFILMGVESANQATIDRLDKGGRVEEFEETMKMCKGAGMEPHVTCMVGYPWESKADAQRTIDLTRNLFAKGYLDSLQATIVIPYPGTPLFQQAQENGWLKTTDWDRYDMREPIMKTSMKDEEIMELTQSIYKSFLTPRFILRKVTSVRNWDDAKFLATAGMRVAGHLTDFSKKQPIEKIEEAESIEESPLKTLVASNTKYDRLQMKKSKSLTK